MLASEKTIDHGSLARLAEAGAKLSTEVIGVDGSWRVVVHFGRSSQTLAASRGGARTFRQFETLAAYLRTLGIVEYRVNATDFEPAMRSQSPPNRRSQLASARMKLAHEAAAYDSWFREQVQASLADERPSVSDEEARAQMAARRQTLLEKSSTPKASGRKSAA